MLQSDLLLKIKNITHSFGTAEVPYSIPGYGYEFWTKNKPRWKQVHGSKILEVTHPNQLLGELDAMFTTEPLVPIGIVTADCVPLFLSKKDGNAVVAIHSGWRGTIAGILARAWETVRDDPNNWIAAIGPCISAPRYEVSESLIDDFKNAFPSIDPLVIEPQKRHLDLEAIQKQILLSLGFSDENIDSMHRCTFSEQKRGKPLFHSYRREGSKQRQLSIIMRIN